MHNIPRLSMIVLVWRRILNVMSSGELNPIIAGGYTQAYSVSQTQVPERRKTVRIAMPFASVVRGVDASGERFVHHGVLDNLSSFSLYLHLARPMKLGGKLLLVVRLSPHVALDTPAPYVALRGTVLRIDQQSGRGYGIAVVINRHRFLYTNSFGLFKP